MRTIKLLLAAGFLLVLGTSVHAQVQRNETYLPKFAIKTNALYWATTTPNLGFEVGLAKKITLDVSGNYNPWKFGDDRQIKHWLVQPELRYWLCERFNGSFFGLHGHYGEMNVSNLNIFGMGHDPVMTAVCMEPVSLTDTNGLSVNAGAWKQPSALATPA